MPILRLPLTISGVLTIGLVSRLLLAPYTTFSDIKGFETAVDLVLVYGFNAASWGTTFGPGFYFFYLPASVPYLVGNALGIYNESLLNFAFKIPPILGDLIVFYSLYETTLLVTRDHIKATGTSAAYFLNPFVVLQSSVFGLFDQLVAGLVLAALLACIKQRHGLAGSLLAVSVSLRFVTVFLLPAYVAFLRRGPQSSHGNVVSFARAFLIIMGIMFLPYAAALAEIYLTSPSSIGHVIQWFFFGVAALHQAFPRVEDFFGLYSLSARLGIWYEIPSLFRENIFYLTFLPLYGLLYFRGLRGQVSLHKLVLYFVAVLSTAIMARPLNFPNLLLWIIPLVILESHVYGSLPHYYSTAITFLALSVGYLTYNPAWHLSGAFPEVTLDWPINLALAWSASVVYSLLVVLTLLLAVSILHKGERTPSSGLSVLPRNRVSVAAMILYLSYSALETGIWAFRLDIPLVSSLVLNIVAPVSVAVILHAKVTIPAGKLFVDPFTRWLYGITIVAASAVYVAIIPFMFGYEVFLPAQVATLTVLFLFNQRSWLSMNLIRGVFLIFLVYLMTIVHTINSLGSNFYLAVGLAGFVFIWVATQYRLEIGKWSAYANQ